MRLYPGSATVSLPSDTEILIERRFDAPVPRVFAAFTTPEHIRRWWGLFTDEDGATRLTVNVRHLTRENRDGHLNAGMEPGMQITFNRLEELLSTLT